MIEIQIKQLKQKYDLWLIGFQEGLNTQIGKAGRWGGVGRQGYQEHLNAETKTPPRLLSPITTFICMMSLFSLTTYFFM